MNIFLTQPDAHASAEYLFKKDPLRANKQIVECTQLLAFVEITKLGKTSILTKHGEPYRATLAQLHHPITLHMCTYYSMYSLCWDVLHGLLLQHPNHACRKSIKGVPELEPSMFTQPKAEYYLVCRKDHPLTTVTTREEYAELMLDYLTHYKWKE